MSAKCAMISIYFCFSFKNCCLWNTLHLPPSQQRKHHQWPQRHQHPVVWAHQICLPSAVGWHNKWRNLFSYFGISPLSIHSIPILLIIPRWDLFCCAKNCQLCGRGEWQSGRNWQTLMMISSPTMKLWMECKTDGLAKSMDLVFGHEVPPPFWSHECVC